jgi:hypothetical protein
VVADGEVRHARSELGDDAGAFMTHHRRQHARPQAR